MSFNERYTDAGNARWFRRCFADSVRYVRERDAWLIDVGTQWVEDHNGEIERLPKRRSRGSSTISRSEERYRLAGGTSRC